MKKWFKDNAITIAGSLGALAIIIFNVGKVAGRVEDIIPRMSSIEAICSTNALQQAIIAHTMQEIAEDVKQIEGRLERQENRAFSSRNVATAP